MRYDIVVIGGGLAGLVCGLRLQKAGQRCAIISSGESTLYFSSGTLGLYGTAPDGSVVADPLSAVRGLDPAHPYSKIGPDRFSAYRDGIPQFFADAGITLCGDPRRNSWRISPSGEPAPCWMAMDGVSLVGPVDGEKPELGSKVLIVNLLGFLDFNAAFIAGSLSRRGIDCRMNAVSLDIFEKLRTSPTEMRAANIARVLERPEILDEFVDAVKAVVTDEDTVVLPAVFGLWQEGIALKVERKLGVRTVFVATMPPSVPGIRTQMLLSDAFRKAGGTFITGDTVVSGNFDGKRLVSVRTVNFDDVPVEAGTFVLASGSFFSKGLVATPESISETALGLDVDYSSQRGDWYDIGFFNRQNYISYGVRTDGRFRAFKDGDPLENVYAAGSILSGANTLAEGSGSGVAVMSALAVADNIIESSKTSNDAGE